MPKFESRPMIGEIPAEEAGSRVNSYISQFKTLLIIAIKARIITDGMKVMKNCRVIEVLILF
jgi:hypothetical protein